MAKQEIERMRHEQARLMYERFLSECSSAVTPGAVKAVFISIIEDALKDRDTLYGAMLRPPRKAKPT